MDELARGGDRNFVRFPRALLRAGNFSFSYSGLKTAVMTWLAQHDPENSKLHQADLAASIQQAIIEPLIQKTLAYAKREGIQTILLAGGVAANSALRSQLTVKASSIQARVFYPSLQHCVDNAAMVAAAAIPKFRQGLFSSLDVNAFSAKGTRML